MLPTTPRRELWFYTHSKRIREDHPELYARVEKAQVVCASGNIYPFDTVLVDGLSWWNQEVRKIIEAESFGPLPDWLLAELGGWDIIYVFDDPKIRTGYDLARELPTNDWTTVERNLHGDRVVQFELYFDEDKYPYRRFTYIYMHDYEDPDIHRQWHKWTRGGLPEAIELETAWDHIGASVDDNHTYVWDPEGMSEVRKQWIAGADDRFFATLERMGEILCSKEDGEYDI